VKVSAKKRPAYTPYVGKEDRRHVRPELRVVADEQEQEERAEQRRRRERRERQLDELVREPVVLGVTGAPADDLDDDGEDRHAEDEGGEVQMELGDRPDRQPRADQRECAVCRVFGRVLGQRRKRRKQGEERHHCQSRPGTPADRTALLRVDYRTRNSQRCWWTLARDELVLSFTRAIRANF
jgi:hypothetical protein